MDVELPNCISVEEVNEMFNTKERFVLLDCRRPEEFAHVALPGAIHIPMDELPERLEELTDARGDRLVVYCHMGVRSRMVSDWLRKNGFAKSQSMEGGIDTWAVRIDPSVDRY